MSTKTVVIHQPDFAPYLGFFHRFLKADLYIALDHVQFVNGTSRAWTHRDRIKTAQGDKWLSVSVKKAPMHTPINQIELTTTVDWCQDHLRQFKQHYAQAPFYAEIKERLAPVYAQSWQRLCDFNMALNEVLMDCLDVRIPWLWSSSLAPAGSKNEMLVDLLHKVGATHYLSGVGARGYFQAELFDQAGITVLWQAFAHPAYPQQHGGFTPYMSVLDLLFNQGELAARQILRNCE